MSYEYININMRTHHDLDVWKNAIQFVTLIYKDTESFPKSELYGITNQIRRSAVSIPSNISEGAARTSKKEFSHFLSIALGSIAELETQLIISKNLDYLNENQFEKLISDLVSIRRMTLGLKKSINKV
jgi:four helix bundle protein